MQRVILGISYPKNHITYRSRSDDGIFKFNLNLMIDVGIISKYYPVFKGIDANQYYLTLHLNYQLKKNILNMQLVHHNWYSHKRLAKHKD